MALVGKQSSLHAPPPLPSTVDELVRTVVQEYGALQDELQVWRWWLVVLGLLHLIAGRTLDVPWGVVLLVVGALSYGAREALVLVVYGGLLLCSALLNLSSLHVGWAILAIAQILGAVEVLRAYARFRHAEARYAQLTHSLDLGWPPPTTHAARVLPWIGAGFGIVALGLSVWTQVPSAQLWWIAPVPLNLAVVGLAMCVASLVHQPRQALAMFGVLASGLVIMVWLTMFLFPPTASPLFGAL